MRRRNLLIGAAALGGAVVAGLKPRDSGAPYDAYFAGLNRELREHGDGRPRLLIDLDILDRNIVALLAVKKTDANYRLVEKSLPCPELIAYILAKTGTQALMSFHLPFLRQDTQRFPDCDILLGKPMPARAAAAFYQSGVDSGFDPARQLCWLIDSDARLAQYQEIAGAHGTRLRIAIEIDVGLHRGGMERPADITPLLQRIQQDADHLQFAGLMGYDAHVGKIPAVVESREQSFAKATARYRAVVDAVRDISPALLQPDTLLNGAGSPTFALHQHDSPCNDLSAGSCLLKPSDFDVATLQGFLPAAFIATPVLKVLDGTRVPGIEWSSDWWRRWNPNTGRAHFVYGGHWMAKPFAPSGVYENALYGFSSNQQIYTASRSAGLRVDDHLFLRPTQSEAVLLQFGDLWTVRGGKVQQRWATLREEA